VLSEAENERLTRVGPGTPCGALMRRYWIPVRPTSMLQGNPVQRVRLLGEDLILYKDNAGTLGLIGDRCLHRLVDLGLGVPDERGLRCPYHGWLYGEDGMCRERPLEKNTGQTGLKIKAYPVRELGGLIFAYMGPAPAPALPKWDLFVWQNAIKQIAVTTLDCNWLQCQENTGDPTHSVYAHGHLFKYILERRNEFDERTASQHHTLHSRISMGIGIKGIHAAETTHGFSKAIEYSTELNAPKDEIKPHATVIFPFYTQTSAAGSPRSEYQIRVPIDDTHTYHICYQVYSAPPGIEAPHQNTIPWYEPPLVDEEGQPVLDYILAQDAYMWIAQGPIVDRSKEVLGRTDIPIVLLRRQLEEQIQQVEEGLDPINFFRDETDSVLHGNGKPPEGWTAKDWPERQRSNVAAFRRMYHHGFYADDVDRYGPMIEEVKDLHRRIEEYATNWNGEAKI
jgi:5,5'-dehydrodivanillate O-demethylase